MPLIRTVYLIGFMGSGKTTAGKKLAASLGWEFIDLDRVIEQSEGMKIADIFSEKGEDHFRQIESASLKNLKPDTDAVVATGGGAPCHYENMDFMKGSGLTIYLRLSPPQLLSRLNKTSGERPLLKNLSGTDLLRYIEKKLDERELYYRMAHLTLDSFDLDIPVVKSAVKSHFSL